MYTPSSYHAKLMSPTTPYVSSIDICKDDSEVSSLRSSSSVLSLEETTKVLERQIINAIMRYVRVAVDQIIEDDTCRRCDTPMQRGTTSTGEPYYGCATCQTLFLIKPAVLSTIFGYHSRVQAITELMAVEGMSYEAAACALEVGYPENVTARRQIHEAYLRYNQSNDET